MNIIEKYGDVLYENLQPDIYQHFTDYFNNPLMEKTKNIDGCSVYMTKVSSRLSVKGRFIVAICHQNPFDVGHKTHLSNIKWQSIQTRTFGNQKVSSTHTYHKNTNSLLNTKIHKFSNELKYSKYLCKELPIDVVVLCGEGINLYNDSMNLINAIELYNTVIELL